VPRPGGLRCDAGRAGEFGLLVEVHHELGAAVARQFVEHLLVDVGGGRCLGRRSHDGDGHRRHDERGADGGQPPEPRPQPRDRLSPAGGDRGWAAWQAARPARCELHASSPGSPLGISETENCGTVRLHRVVLTDMFLAQVDGDQWGWSGSSVARIGQQTVRKGTLSVYAGGALGLTPGSAERLAVIGGRRNGTDAAKVVPA
jgi:hypothetical protein